MHAIAINNFTTIELENRNIPTGSKLPQSDLDDMDEFKENMIFVFKNLGILDFTKLKAIDKTRVTNKEKINRRN